MLRPRRSAMLAKITLASVSPDPLRLQAPEGHLVIHRITGGDGAAGFVVKGDNNEAVDPWSPRAGDIAGKAWGVVPGLGRFIAFIHQPVIAGGLAAALMVTFILARPSRPTRRAPALSRAGPRATP